MAATDVLKGITNSTTWFKTLEPASGWGFAINRGDIISIQGSIPATLAAFEKNGTVERLKAEPGIGLDVLAMTAEDFAKTAPIPAQVEQPISTAELMARRNLRPEDLEWLRQACANMPKPLVRGMVTAENPDARNQMFWLLSAFDRFVREFAPVVEAHQRAADAAGR